jgi:hypothetical protein
MVGSRCNTEVEFLLCMMVVVRNPICLELGGLKAVDNGHPMMARGYYRSFEINACGMQA